MKNPISLLSVSIIVFFAQASLAQQAKSTNAGSMPDFGPAVNTASLTIGSDQHTGYSALFDFDEKTVEKGWWRYLKRVARVKDRKTYWRLSIPPEKGTSNRPVEMFSEITKANDRTKLTLVLNGFNMVPNTKKDYLQQTKYFLEEFKAKFYGDYVQGLIIKAEKKAKKASQQHQKAIVKQQKLIISIEKARSKSSGMEAGAGLSDQEVTLENRNQTVALKAREVEAIQKEIASLKKILLTYIQKSKK